MNRGEKMQDNLKRGFKSKKDSIIEELEKELKDEKSINIEFKCEINNLKRDNRKFRERVKELEKKLDTFYYEEDPQVKRYRDYSKELESKIKDLEGALDLYSKRIKELESVRKQSNTKLKPREQQITQKEIDYIKELVSQGVTYRRIKDKVGWSINTISRVMNGVYDK